MYTFATRPRWLVSHVVVVALVVLMVGLGLWQLRRLDDRRATSALLEQRIDQPAEAFSSILAEPVGTNGLRFTPTEIEGVFDEQTVLVANRTFDGAPGFWLLTPVVDGTGRSIAVVRGFVTRSTIEQASPASFAPGAPLGPSAGTVTVTGYVEDASADGRIAQGDDDPARVNKVAPGVLSELYGEVFDPYYVVADGPQSAEIFVLPRPSTGDGPHLSYAVQWFVFATIAGIGYLLIVRRQAHSPQQGRGAAESEKP